MSEHPQFTTPEGNGSFDDTEPDEIATESLTEHYSGPEEAAMHIEDTEEGSGRVDRPTSGYVDEP